MAKAVDPAEDVALTVQLFAGTVLIYAVTVSERSRSSWALRNISEEK